MTAPWVLRPCSRWREAGPLDQEDRLSGGALKIAVLISELEATRWTGRPGYLIRSMVGMALAKSIYSIPTWTRTVALVREPAALRTAVVDPSGPHDVLSVYACYRFATKLRTYGDPLAACLDP